MGEALDRVKHDLGWDSSNPKGEGEETMKDVTDEIERSYTRGAKTRAYMEGAGFISSRVTGSDAKGAEGKAEEAVVVQSLNILSNIVDKALGKLTESQNRPGVDDATKATLETMKAEIGAIKEKLVPTGSPWDNYKAIKGELDEWAGELLKRTGYQGATTVTASDVPQLLDLEEKRLEREEKQRQHEKEMEESRQRYQTEREDQRRQWGKEDAQWERQHKLEMAKFIDSRKSRDRAMETLEDLGSAVVDALEAGEGGEPGGEVKKETPSNIEVLACPECKAKVSVPKDVDFVFCPKCGIALEVMVEE